MKLHKSIHRIYLNQTFFLWRIFNSITIQISKTYFSLTRWV